MTTMWSAQGSGQSWTAQPNLEVVAEAADGKEAIFKAIETKPDVAVVDYSLPLINGIEVTRQIRARLPKTEVLIFTMHRQRDGDGGVGEGGCARLPAQVRRQT